MWNHLILIAQSVKPNVLQVTYYKPCTEKEKAKNELVCQISLDNFSKAIFKNFLARLKVNIHISDIPKTDGLRTFIT
jgi:hypothetical protein